MGNHWGVDMSYNDDVTVVSFSRDWQESLFIPPVLSADASAALDLSK